MWKRVNARTSPGSDLQEARPPPVVKKRGLPRDERPRLKTLVRVGSLNIGTLTGKTREIADLMKRRRIHVLCLQETRWKGSKAREIGDGVKLFYHGFETRRNGVAIAIAGPLKEHVSSVNRVSDRIISLRIATEDGFWTVVSVYAPQCGCTEADKEAFYEELDDVIRSAPEGDYITIAGDFNGHVGQDRRGFERVHGGRGLGSRNQEGERIIGLAEAHDLAIASTFFIKRESQKITYCSGGRQSEIDHILVRRLSLKTVKNVKTIPGEEIAGQHRPVVADICITLPKPTKPKLEPRIRWWKLAGETLKTLREKIVATGLPDPCGPIDAVWASAASTILTCARDTLGETRGGRRGDKATWFWSEDLQKIVKAKKNAYKAWQNTKSLSALSEYKLRKREAKAAVARAKNAAMDDLYDKLESSQAEKYVYRLAKARHRASLDVTEVRAVKSEEGDVLRDPMAVKERWRAYFAHLLNEEFPRKKNFPGEPVAGPVQQWTVDEVRKAVKKMKVGKAPGPDGIPMEAWRSLGELGLQWLTKFFNNITRSAKIPEAWKDSIIVPIFKRKGDVMDCANYRGIKLIAHTMKIYERLLDMRLRDMVEIAADQFGFVPERSTIDAIFIARQVMEKYREKNKPCHIAFLDLEKAYDRLPRAVIWDVMRKRGIPEYMVKTVQVMYEGTTARVRTSLGTTSKFDITVGVHQGSALSPFLFIMTLDTVVKHLLEGPPCTLLYADDVAVIADSTAELQVKIQKWQTALADAGLKLNLKKTEVMSSIGGGDAVLDVNGTAFTQTEEFQYLGSILSADGTVDAAVRGRIACAWLKWRESTGILCDRRCSRVLKGKIYRTVVRPAMMYGSECWPVSKTHERMLNTAEMRMLRWACGLTRRDKVRNEDIRALMQTAPIQQKLRAQRLRWFGHVMRRSPLHPTRQAMDMEVIGKRPRGAPKKRWKDTVNKDMKELGITKDDAQDRDLWRRRTKTADPVNARDKR
ncbi:hypothetical protein Y032_0401g787 [Ancylostoma ceylanicum]|uniref:Reverse transcriptase domain-containing protein n=1 Tax=Ancylostoma ceylanicum TaxID=53326 RepID=A0A016X2L9_9BILA|nr:hypothetical protein Y032_0401g787 [Ancylostoma ceylanicum]